MTNHPFKPNDERDHLNTALDALATEKRAPETDPASDIDALTATARLITGQSAEPGEYPSDDTLDSIWRNVMHSQSQALPAQAPLAPFSPNRNTFPGRVPNVPPRTETSRFGSWLSIAAMVALLVGLIGGAWGARQSGGGEDDPIRLAATVLDETPEVSTGDSEWLTFVQPEECSVEPMTTEEYGDIMREEPDISGRSYEVVGPADPETAEAAAQAARAHEACLNFGSYKQVRTLESPAFQFYRSASVDNSLSAEDKHLADIEHGEQISEQMPAKDPSAYAAISTDNPPEQTREKFEAGPPITYSPFFYAYNPDNAMMLGDGRIALPVTSLHWADGPWIVPPTQEQIDSSTRLSTFMLILLNDSGSWKLDEQLLFCSGVDCGDFWAEHWASPEPVIATPGASPVATPME